MSGFTYNGVHCEDMGCTYIPDASSKWFNSPDIDVSKDDVNWRDGSYYYYTRRRARTFSLNCYFENISLNGRERIRRWLDEKGSGYLVFDDREYVQYHVRPSKVVSGKIYRQNEGYQYEDYYNGTFTVTFEAVDPYGYLTKLTDNTMLDTQQDNVCNLIRADMMPTVPTPGTTRSMAQFKIYNQGTQPCGITFKIGGSAPNGIQISNSTNGSLCRLRGLPPSGKQIIDSDTGLVSTESQYGTEITFAYHDYGYITLAPNDMLNYVAYVERTSGSTSATILTEVPEDLTGCYLWIDNAWNKINSMDSAGNAVLNSAASTTDAGNVHVAKMNEIVVAGSGASMTWLEYSYQPRAL